jgi:chromosomal replication initiator protein
LSSYLKNNTIKALDVEKIQEIVASHFSIKVTDLNSKSRLRNIAKPRQIAMYLAKKHTKESLANIGSKFGGKNHATVIHSEKQILLSVDKDQKLLEDIKTIEEKLFSK